METWYIIHKVQDMHPSTKDNTKKRENSYFHCGPCAGDMRYVLLTTYFFLIKKHYVRLYLYKEFEINVHLVISNIKKLMQFRQLYIQNLIILSFLC